MMQFRNGILHIGEVAVPALLDEYDSPLYVYDASVIRRQIERVRSAFASLPFQPFYAMKANDNLEILRMIGEAGFGCDCVSPGEVFLAKRAGYSPDRIWFTSSSVSDRDLLDIADPAVVINVNSMSDIDRCIRLELPNPIALRVNPDIGAGHHKDVVTGGFGVKFGIDLAEILDARDVAESAGLEVVGLHAHIGSGITEVEPLLESARRLLVLSAELNSLRYVNFGGGIAVPYAPGDTDFPIEEYGEELSRLATPVLEKRGLTAILEPGRYLVAKSGTLLASVTSKRISAGHEWLGCDTGFNHLARPSRYGSYHHIVNASRGSDDDLRDRWRPSVRPRVETIVAGNLCESGDVFTRDLDGIAPRLLPSSREGDILAFCDAGAYGFSMASHYNARLLPAEVMVDGSEARLIRERQRLQDLLRGQTR
ncbi:MAG TPA: diaminopimelate decarboxylase [Thermoanaerobaculia bacterium]|nr:diaminopimelate decarboxylase [Thermoanaerobaculia bacterium]